MSDTAETPNMPGFPKLPPGVDPVKMMSIMVRQMPDDALTQLIDILGKEAERRGIAGPTAEQSAD